MDAGEQRALGLVVQVMDRERRDDRVERAGRQRSGHVGDVHRAHEVTEALPGLVEHRLGPVEELDGRLRMGRQDGGTDHPGARAQVQNPLRAGYRQPEHVNERAVEAVEVRDKPPARAIVVRRVLGERRRCRRTTHSAFVTGPDRSRSDS